MKRFIPLTIVAFVLNLAAAVAQTINPDTTVSGYEQRKLKLEEVNFVTGYYSQDGNNSAVTGGIGTEKLTDFSNTFDVSLSRYDAKNRKHTFDLQLGFDTYTSASSDKIDPSTISSASYSDKRIYPSLNWNVSNENKGTTFGANVYYSTEYDYQSIGTGLNFIKTSADKHREFGVKAQFFFDTWKIILPIELRGPGADEESSPRNTYSLALSWMQVINKSFQALLLVEPSYQHGLLATKYQRVYFTNNSEASEELPSSRYKLPIGVRLNYFLTDRIIIRTLNRFYTDDWGINSYTGDIEVPVKITPFVSLSPFYRYYNQSSADYFAPYASHQAGESFFTSDYDLSSFNSNFFGTGLRLAPPKGIFTNHLSMLEIRYGHYKRSNGLASDIVSLNLKFK